MTTTVELETELANLRALQSQQKAMIVAAPNRKAENAARKVLVRIQDEIEEVEARIAHRDRLDAKLATGSKVVTTGRVTKIRCHKAKREIGKDEPLLFIATFDMANTVDVVGISVAIPTINVFVIGPWKGVGKNETHKASVLEKQSRPDFWNTESEPQPIDHHQDVLVLAALVESDKSSAHAVRGLIRSELRIAMANNLNRAYDSLVTTMISNMQGTIESSKAVLGLGMSMVDADDLIDRPKRVPLTAGDVRELQQGCAVLKKVEFKQTNRRDKPVNHYTATFRFGP